MPCPSQELITYPVMNSAEKQPELPAVLHLLAWASSLPTHRQPEVGWHGHPLAPGDPWILTTHRKKKNRSPACHGSRPKVLLTGGQYVVLADPGRPCPPALSLESAVGTRERETNVNGTITTAVLGKGGQQQQSL